MSIVSVSKHNQALLTQLNELRKEETICDVILIADDGQRIPAHRVILSASSDYFRAMFTSKLLESTEKEVKMEQIDGIILEQLIAYCYTGEMEVDNKTVAALVEAAAYLQLGDLLNELHRPVNAIIDTTNCFQLLTVTKQLECSKLINLIENFMCDVFIKIAEEPDFLKLDIDSLLRLLANDDLHIIREVELFRILLQWLEHDDSTRRPNFPALLEHLRLARLPPKFIMDHIEPLCNRDLLKSILRFSLMPANTTDVPKMWQTKTRKHRELLIVVRVFTNYTTEIVFYGFDDMKWHVLHEMVDWYDNYAVTYLNESLYFVGGILHSVHSNKVFRFDFKKNLMTELGPMPAACRNVQLGVIDEHLIILGGYVIDGKRKASDSILCHRAGTCTRAATMPTPKANFSSVIFGESIYCIGGDENGQRSQSVWSYKHKTNTIVEHLPINHPRANCGIANYNGALYIIGGGSDVIECYEPATEEVTEFCTVRGSQAVTACVEYYNKIIAFGNGIVLELDPINFTFKPPNDIKPLPGVIVAAFSC